MSKRRHNQQQTYTKTKDTKNRDQIIIAIIGLIGTIVAAFLASPLIEKWNNNTTIPSSTVTAIIVQSVDTQLVVAQEYTPSVNPGDVVDAKGVIMALVPAGKFNMGSDIEYDEKPPHDVDLNAFYMDKYEVTNSLYNACIDAGVCSLPKDTRHYDDVQYTNHPVIYVNWDMAKTYCEWRDARLPTEAEWEKAARGVDGRTYPWGEVVNCEQANYGSCVGDTTEVGKYKNGASPYGIYDMAGNVWEWVSDWYLSDYYSILGSDALNPPGPSTGDGRVERGGGWNSSKGTSLRSTNRISNNPLSFFDSVGFRCARSETISVAATAAITQTAIAEEQNLPLKIVDPKQIEMVLVPSGEFTMGTNNDDADSGEKPAHQVNLRAFYIDKYEVTNALYKICVDVGICNLPTTMGSQTRDSYFDNNEFNDYPVIAVTWNMARIYCEWRDARLPTEAEWEKAARGTDQRAFPWGDTIDESFANYNLYVGDTTPVRNYDKDRSTYDVYDMAGNVSEWIADWYSAGYYNAVPYENPRGPELGKYRSVRGGSYYDAKDYAMTFHRSNQDPEKSFYNHGFRCAKDANP